MDFVINDQSGQMKALEAIQNLDLKKKWRVTLKRYQKRRSVSQNALLWAWYEQLSEYTGYETDELHEFFKAKFLPATVIEIGGDKYASRTTTTLSTGEFMNFMDQILRFAATEVGVQLRYPEDEMVP